MTLDHSSITQASPATLELLGRIEQALNAAASALRGFIPGRIQAQQKSGGRGPVTEADHIVSDILCRMLVRDDDGWLSEETTDDFTRLDRRRVWIVDPIDGTRDLVAGIPDWCVSVGLVEDGCAVAGGVLNPSTCQLFLGSAETGLLYNGSPARASQRTSLDGALVLASRRELSAGKWNRFTGTSLDVRPVSSVAYKLAQVGAGLADATWTLAPKHEWDIAGGVALVKAGGGFAEALDGSALEFNRRSHAVPGLVAGGPQLREELLRLLSDDRI